MGQNLSVDWLNFRVWLPVFSFFEFRNGLGYTVDALFSARTRLATPAVIGFSCLLMASCARGPAADDQSRFQANARAFVALHVEPNKLGVDGREFKAKPNPIGKGCFVYESRTQFFGVQRNLVWWVPEDGKAHPLNGPSKMVTPRLEWPREAGLEAPSTEAVIAYVFDNKPMASPGAEAAGPELAAFSCSTKEAARQIRKTSDMMKLFEGGCWIDHPDQEAFVGEEDGLVKVRVRRDGSIRWTVYQHEAAK